MPTSETTDRGLDADGFVRREGSVDLIQPDYRPLVDDLVSGARETFGPDLDGVLLYGSIPRGTARRGISDVDGQILLTREPDDTHRAAVETLERRLHTAYPDLVSTVEILLDSRAALTDPADRHDGGFHVRVLCTPVWGTDPAEEVEPHRPDLALALGVQGDWRGALDRLDEQLAGSAEPLDPRLTRAVGRRLTRIAFAWVLPRWGGWSSDPEVMHAVVTAHEPKWSEPMRTATRLGWLGDGQVGTARALMSTWRPELVARGEALSRSVGH